MKKYNTDKEPIILKEYGRNVQMIAEQIMEVEDKETRTKMSHALVELMKQVNPNLKDQHDNNQFIWDNLHIITGFSLDIEAPFPKPDKKILDRRPEKVAYNSNKLSYKTYGKNIELLIERAIETEDPEDKKAGIIYICKLMKRFYFSWNKDTPEDFVIIRHLKELSNGKLELDLDEVKESNLLAVNFKDLETPNQSSQSSSSRDRSSKSSSSHRNNGSRGGSGRSQNGGYKSHSNQGSYGGGRHQSKDRRNTKRR